MRWSEEDLEQKAFVDWLQIMKNNKKIIAYFSIQNENKMSWAVKNKNSLFAIANKDKAMGKRKGVSDMCVILKKYVLFIEMKKKPKQLKTKLSYANIEVSKEQIQFIKTVSMSDVVYGSVTYGALEAIDYVKQFLDFAPKENKNQGRLFDNPLD